VRNHPHHRLLVLAVLCTVTGPRAEGIPPGRLDSPPGPHDPAPRALSMNDDQRRAVRGCPVGYDCHHRLSEELREFERRRFGRRSSSPWIESDGPGARRTPMRRATDPTKLRPDLPWLAKLQLPDLPVVWDERVIAYLEFYKDDPRGRRIMSAWLKAQGRYKNMIEEELRDAGLPHDLLYIAMIESSYDATEYSRSGASGLWQFMPGGGRIYGLTVNRWLDERNDPQLATKAAAYYFKDLYQRFGNWHLAMAAYNAGYGAVLKGMAKYNTNDFWQLLDYENALPWESSLYVPKALAAAIVGNNRDVFGYDTSSDPEIRWDHVEVPKSVSLTVVARAAGTDVATIERLNPQLRRGRTPPGMDRYVLRIPEGHSGSFAQRFPQMRGDWDDTDAYLVRHGERFEDIATRYGISRKKLRELNGITTEAEVHGGMILVVPKVSEETARSNQKRADDDLYTSGEPGGEPGDGLIVALPQIDFSEKGKKRVFYRVVAGDSQFSVASAFGIDRHQLARWNGLDPEAHLQPRMVLQLFVSPRFDTRKANVKLLDAHRVLLVQSGSTKHLDLAENRVGRKRVVYRASKREDFTSIGKRYGLSNYDLARINRMSPSTVLESGQEILVYEVIDPKASERAQEQAKKARKHTPKPRKPQGKPKKKQSASPAATRAIAKAPTQKPEAPATAAPKADTSANANADTDANANANANADAAKAEAPAPAKPEPAPASESKASEGGNPTPAQPPDGPKAEG